jgi:DNA-directed RNA polymerase specialized sigma24 family protein
VVIGKLCATDPPPPLDAWIRVLVRRAAIDYLRASPEYVRATPDRDARWVTLQSLISSTPDRAPNSLAEKRAQLLTFVRDAATEARDAHAAHGDDAIGLVASAWSIHRVHVRRLIQRGEVLVTVLERVLAGQSFPEIATALGRTRREIELAVHYVEELLAARGFPR